MTTQYTTERYRAAVQYGEVAAGAAPLAARAADLRLMHGVGSAHASPAVLHAHAFHPLHAHVVHAAREWQKLAALLHCAAPMVGLLHAGLQPAPAPAAACAGWHLPAYPVADRPSSAAPGWCLPANPDFPAKARRPSKTAPAGILKERNNPGVDIFQYAAMGGAAAFNKQMHV